MTLIARLAERLTWDLSLSPAAKARATELEALAFADRKRSEARANAQPRRAFIWAKAAQLASENARQAVGGGR